MHGPPSGFTETDYPHQRVSGAIIAAAYQVHAAFGHGFLEAVYRRALAVELQHMRFQVEREAGYDLFHRGVCVGTYRADLVVERCVVAEVKAGSTKDPFAPRQLLNYLRAAKLGVGLLLHFGPKLEVRRIVHEA